jgi:predicted metal-dependent TIM-barrel fold hydrolase
LKARFDILHHYICEKGRAIGMTRLFDPHIHMYSRTTDDYDLMSKAGIEVIVQPSFWLGGPRSFVGTCEDYWEHMLTFETQRAREFAIEHYVCISVNPKEANVRPLGLDAIDAMTNKGYLDRERVVAVGEIGYNLINELEEEVFVKQMDIAADRDLLMTIHLPHNNKVEGMNRIESILNDSKKYKRETILVDHNVEETIEKTLDLGLWAGLSVYPYTKLSPDRAMKILKKHGTENIMIHSAADWGVSDPLSVPFMAREMRKSRDFSIEEIEKVTFYNAYEFFKQSSRFTWRP